MNDMSAYSKDTYIVRAQKEIYRASQFCAESYLIRNLKVFLEPTQLIVKGIRVKEEVSLLLDGSKDVPLKGIVMNMFRSIRRRHSAWCRIQGAGATGRHRRHRRPLSVGFLASHL
jgi:hypothetical protein